MAAQRPWFRMTTMRPPAPAPAPAPPPAPAPAPAPPPAPAPARPPAVVRPAIPIRPPPPPPQPQEPPPPPAAASQPPTAPPSPPAPAPPTSPAAPPPPASPMAAPPAPQPSPPRASAATAAAPPPPPRSPAAPPAPLKSPPRAPVAAPAPAPAAPPPPPPSPVAKAAATTPQIKARSPPSPVPKPLSTTNFKAATPISSPKTANPPSRHPPSPLQLPPAQIKPPSEEEREPKIEQKSVLVQDDKPTKTNSNAHNYASKGKRGENPTKEKGPTKKLSDSEELGTRVITIAGDNRGALMEINSSRKKTYPPAKGYTLAKSNQHGGEDGASDDKDKDLAAQSQPMATFLNSNVQGINNSIVYHGNCHHNDPGIHLSLVRKVNGNNGGRGHHG